MSRCVSRTHRSCGALALLSGTDVFGKERGSMKAILSGCVIFAVAALITPAAQASETWLIAPGAPTTAREIGVGASDVPWIIKTSGKLAYLDNFSTICNP